MPVRLNAVSPGAFIRDHLKEVGSDYPQSIFRAYKAYLKEQGVQHILSRSAMSSYIWMAKELGLIEFDHAEVPEYFGDKILGSMTLEDYEPPNHPESPSPRHYYRLIRPDDPRWDRLGTSYKESLGYEVPEARPSIPARSLPEEEEA